MKAKSKYMFLLSLATYSFFTFLNDGGLQMDWFSHANALIIQVIATYALAFTTAASLMWSSGAVQLFFSKLQGTGNCVGHSDCSEDVCGCYYQMGDTPSLLAVAVPINLLLRLRGKTISVMRAAIVGQSYLSTQTFYVPFDFLPAGSLSRWSALGPAALGSSPYAISWTSEDSGKSRMVLAKRLARCLCVACPLIVFFPMLFSSCSLIYRSVAISISFIESWLRIHIGAQLIGSQAMCGFYGMIFFQFGVFFLFIPETWRLFYILSLQLGSWQGDLSNVKSHLADAHPEIGWALTD